MGEIIVDEGAEQACLPSPGSSLAELMVDKSVIRAASDTKSDKSSLAELILDDAELDKVVSQCMTKSPASSIAEEVVRGLSPLVDTNEDPELDLADDICDRMLKHDVPDEDKC